MGPGEWAGATLAGVHQLAAGTPAGADAIANCRVSGAGDRCHYCPYQSWTLWLRGQQPPGKLLFKEYQQLHFRKLPHQQYEVIA